MRKGMEPCILIYMYTCTHTCIYTCIHIHALFRRDGGCVVVFCSVLHCVAVCCSVLQCVAVCCSERSRFLLAFFGRDGSCGLV